MVLHARSGRGLPVSAQQAKQIGSGGENLMTAQKAGAEVTLAGRHLGTCRRTLC